jgi:hypothetical protein
LQASITSHHDRKKPINLRYLIGVIQFIHLALFLEKAHPIGFNSCGSGFIRRKPSPERTIQKHRRALC